MVAPIRFLSGRQQQQKIGVQGSTENEKVLEVIGRVGIGSTIFDPLADLDVRGDVRISGELTVGDTTFGSDISTRNLNVTGVSTFAGNINANGNIVGDTATNISGINSVTATSFFGDGSGLENTGALLSAASGTQRLVLTSLTTGTMISAATDADLSFNATSNLLSAGKLIIAGISTFQSDVSFGSTATFGDDDRLKFGDGQDLQIYHDGSNSYVRESGTGALRIVGDQVAIRNNAENMAVFNTNADVQLYYDNSKKFETTGIGISVLNGTVDTATIAGPSNLIIDPGVVGDNTGIVRIKGDLIVDGTETTVNSTTVEIADKVIGIATTCTSDLLTDGAGIGIGSDKTFLYEFNSGTNPSLKSSENLNVPTGKGYQVNQVEVLNATTLGSSVVNSSLTSVGTLTNLNVSGISTFQNTTYLKNYNKLKFGLSESTPDLEIYHDSSRNSFIDSNTKSLFIRNNVDDDGARGNIVLQAKSGEDSAKFVDEGQVELYYDNSKKFETTGAGVTVFGTTQTLQLNVTGVSTFAGAIDANGDLDVDGHTELDNVNVSGVLTATSFVGNGSGLTNLSIPGISTSGTTTFNDLNVTGFSTFAGAIDANGDLDVDGHTELDNVNVSGVSTFQESVTFQSNASFGDNDKAIFGDGQDLQIYHGGNNGIIENTTGNLFIRDNGNNVFIQGKDGENSGIFRGNGSVELYHDDSKKFETTNTGALVTGTLVATAITGDGSGLTNLDIPGISTGGTTTFNDLNVTGFSTFAGAIDANGDLDVDGHTELDNVNVSGVLTATSFVGNGSGLTNLDIPGISTDGTTTFNDLNVIGVSTFGGAIDANGDLDVDGHTELDNLNVSGISTFNEDIQLRDGKDLFLFDSNEQSTGRITTGAVGQEALSIHSIKGRLSLTCQSTTGANAGRVKITSHSSQYIENAVGNTTRLQINGSGAIVTGVLTATSFVGNGSGLTNLNVPGISTSGTTTFTNLNVTGVSTFAGAIDANGSIDVDGHTELDNVNVSGIITATESDIAFLTTKNYSRSWPYNNWTSSQQGVTLATTGRNLIIQAGGAQTTRSYVSLTNGGGAWIGGGYGDPEGVNIDAGSGDVKITGDVGINTTIPSEKLDVVGTVKATSFSGNGSGLTNLNVPGISTSGTTTFTNLNVTGVSTFAGDVSIADKITHIGDTDTAIRFPAADTFTVETGGSERLRIDSNGMVKLGTGGTPTDILDVHKDSTTTYDATDDNAQRTNSASITVRNDNGSTNTFSQLVFDTAGSNQSIARIVALRTGSASNALTFVTEHSNTKAERLRITSNGNVGIGTDNPVALLNPHGTAALTNTNQVVLISDSNSDDAIGRGGNLGFAGYANGNLRTLAGIGGIKRNAGNSFNGDLGLYTRVNGEPNLYERVRITSDGSVGIGTDDPSTKLEIAGTGSPTFRISDLDGTNQFGQILANNGTFVIESRNNSSNGKIIFRGRDGSGTVEYGMFDSNGNFRIGSDNPTEKLDVSGTVKATSFVGNGSGLTNLNVPGISTSGSSTFTNLNVTGVSTFAGAIDANGDLDVDGHTELDNLNVSGVSTFQNNVHLLDDDKLLLGGSSGTYDGLEIYHDGSHSYIDDSGTGNLYLRSGTLSIQNLAGSKTSAVFNSGGGQELYHNNSKKFETTGIGVSIINGTSDTATISAPANLIIDPAVVGDNTGIVRIKGDLFVDGTQTTVNSTTVEIADKVIGIATTCTSDLLTDGAGIGIGTDKTFLYEHNSGTNPSLKSSENLNVSSGKGYQINQVEVLNATTLGSSVVNSSLTSVGTLSALTVSGDLSIADKIVHTGDTNTAIRFPAADTITAETDGTERLRITSAGKVGIGTTNPQSRLHVNGTHNSHIRMTNTANDAIDLIGDSNRSGQDQNIFSIKSRWNGTDVARISFKTGSDTTDKDDAGITFHTKESGSDIAERLRITSAGKVGIGTNDPSHPLHIYPVEGTNGIAFDTVSNVGTGKTSLSTVTETRIFSASKTVFRSVELSVQATEGTNYHFTKIHLIHDGTNVYLTEYGTVFNNSPVATFNSDINNNFLRLLATSASSNQTDYHMHIVGIRV